MPLHVSSTVVLIIRRTKLYYTSSGIVTPVGGRPVCTGGESNVTKEQNGRDSLSRLKPTGGCNVSERRRRE